MSFLLPILLSSMLASLAIAPAPRMWSQQDYDRFLAKIAKDPLPLTSERLPKGYSIGKCLLVVKQQTRISGSCAYQISKGGDFVINGSRQIFDGIDYPKAQGMAEMISNDYWASIFKDDDGTWTGYGNEEIRSVHGEGPNFGPLRREGACLAGQDVRVCLWKKS